jgi:signal transduction histidine kinase/ActR/RegA family two-component response regulator
MSSNAPSIPEQRHQLVVAGDGPAAQVSGPEPLLREREALRHTFDLLEDGLYLFDAAGQLQLENAAGHRLRAGPALSDAADAPAFFLAANGDAGIGESSLHQVISRLARAALGEQRVACASLSRSGQHLEVRARPTTAGHALVHVRDLTEDREGEVRRMQSEKLASIGMLAAGVAHEINNPASFVLANTEALGSLLRLLDEKLKNDPASARRLGLKDLLFEATAIVQESKEGMARIHRIVRDLHSFSRVEDDPRGLVDVNAAIASALTMLRNELRYRAEVNRSLTTCRPVRGSSARLGQVFLNLLLNAAHALPEGQVKRNRIWVRSFDEGAHVVVEVEDNGPGISAEAMPRIFESFFTTKPAGLGTGLGLSISREIVRDAGGDIMAESSAGKGALFRVRLPAGEGPMPVLLTPAPQPNRRRYRVLAIDDEILLLKAYRRMLIDHHDVEMAPGGVEALRRLEKDRDFDVILCDLQMPEISGADVFHAVAERWPGLEKRMVIITGGAFSPEARGFLEQGLVASLNKPFKLEEILDLIDRRARANG